MAITRFVPFVMSPTPKKLFGRNFILLIILLFSFSDRTFQAAAKQQDLRTFSLFPCPDMAGQATQFRGNNPSMAAMMPAKHHSRALQFPRRRERVKSKQQNSFRLRNASAPSWEKIFAKTLFSLSKPVSHFPPMDKF